MTNISRRQLFFAVAPASLVPWASVFGKSWEQPSFPNWKTEFVDQILTDSPWAKPSNMRVPLPPEDPPPASQFQVGSPGSSRLPIPGIPGTSWPGTSNPRTNPRTQPGSPWPGRGDRTPRFEVSLTTRWWSALPVRQALALSEFGRDGLSSKGAAELLDWKKPEYVVVIAGFPTLVVRQGAEWLGKQLEQSARLIIGGHRLAPISVDVPEYGTHLIATLRFHRQEGVTANDGLAEITASAGAIKVEQRFPLKSMLYRGNLEL